MKYTNIPSIKGQVTLPAEIRKKYSISKDTPLQISDAGHGVIHIKVMHVVAYDDIKYFEDEHSVGLHFKNGVDPQLIIDEIDAIDGQNR